MAKLIHVGSESDPVEVNGKSGNRGIWINPDHIVMVEDWNSSAAVTITLVGGTKVFMDDYWGDVLQGFCRYNSYTPEGSDWSTLEVLEDSFDNVPF